MIPQETRRVELDRRRTRKAKFADFKFPMKTKPAPKKHKLRNRARTSSS